MTAAVVLEAGTGRPVRDCHHPRARHEHGTPNGYVLDRCRCTPCTAANTAREDSRNRAKRHGTYDSGRVPAAPVRDHIQALRARGYGLKRIAKLAGVSQSTLGKVIYGDRVRGMPPRERVEKHVAAGVLAVRPSLSTLGETVPVSSAQMLGMFQHLMCLGYSMSWVARQIGMEPSNFGRVLGESTCRASTARKVRDLYLLVWDKPRVPANRREAAATTRTLQYAAEQGWQLLPPPPGMAPPEEPVAPAFGLEKFLADRQARKNKSHAATAAQRPRLGMTA